MKFLMNYNLRIQSVLKWTKAVCYKGVNTTTLKYRRDASSTQLFEFKTFFLSLNTKM